MYKRRKGAYSGNLAVAINPFSTKTTHAKIPDGKTNLSSGQRIQKVDSVDFVGVSVPSGIMEVLLFPGINNQVSILKEGTTNVPDSLFVGTTHCPISSDGQQVEAALRICAWRTVSCGLKINLVNNAESNEGWFEAKRVNLCDGNSFRLNTGVTAPASGAFVVANSATNDGLGPTKLGENFALTPTFCSGKLRDIHKYNFSLKMNTDDHDFVTFNGADGGTNTADKFVDTAMDAILIRLHGSSTSKFMFHSVSNQEIIYDENTALYRTSTRTYHSPTEVDRMQQTPGVSAAYPSGPITPYTSPKKRKSTYSPYRRTRRRLMF